MDINDSGGNNNESKPISLKKQKIIQYDTQKILKTAGICGLIINNN
jgi:hypothetical protein